MILGFKKDFPWKEPTNFKEKILSGVKIHTLRMDSDDRWKAGRSIQMAYGVRTKNYEQFNKGLLHLQKCTGVQKIKISCVVLPLHGGDPETYFPKIEIDGRILHEKEEVLQLVRNDGFESITDFCRWFKDRFTGVIVHWTDYRY